MIGVLGGYGGVGTAAAHQLSLWGLGPLRIGGRSRERAERLADALGDGAEAVAVDISDARSLREFCDGCELVVNCAGPASIVLDTAARGALAAGSHYVDVAGDGALLRRIARMPVPRDRVALVGAGMMPGLTGLLGRALAAEARRQAGTRLTIFAGGRARLTPAAAADFVSGFVDGFGEPLAAWRDGARCPRVLVPLVDVDLPFFPETVTAYPFLSTEAERLGREYGLAEIDCYTVFGGAHLAQAVRSVGSLAATDVAAAAERVVRAADLDVFGRRPYQLLVVRLEEPADDRARTIVLRGADALELTGAAVAVACEEILAARVPAGVSLFAEALELPTVLRRLAETEAVESVTSVQQPAGELPLVEEGVL